MPTAVAVAEVASAPVRLSQSEVMVLQADGAAALASTARQLADWIDGHPDASVGDVAYSLSEPIETAAATLGIVATSLNDFAKKLRSAADRLERPDCKQIKDSAGVYYFALPLGRVGKLALLFPGEGAQYLDMLGDLAPRFAVIRDYLAQTDANALELSSRGEGLSQLLCVPDHWGTDERKLAEVEFASLGTAMFGVLAADWAIHLLLEHLGVVPAATAGHSMGEFAALRAAGGVDGGSENLGKMVRTIEALEGRYGAAADSETTLFAVGIGRETLDAIAAKLGLPDIYVGMDNCPHQSVVVGKSKAMAAVEAELKSRGTLYERLPFRRPYHTPLFAPMLGQLDAMFDGTVFQPPRIPVYSCTTAMPFPDDPVAIRDLTTAHWAAPVEFTRTIERMHADGVRLFVEAGPRGNLSAFVEDILRGKSFAAIPANVARRSGMVQFNHLLAQLAAHGVAIRWDRLYQERNVARIDDLPIESAHGPQVKSDPLPTQTWNYEADRNGHAESSEALSERAQVFASYLQVMDQFLDLQRETMSHFLRGSETATAVTELEFSHGDFQVAEFANSRTSAHRPLLGELVAFEPGHSLLARRQMTLDEVRFAGDHTVGGRRVSRVDPDQNGVPVMPMTGTLEMMAEHAELLADGLKVVAVENVRLARWLAVDDPPHTIEIAAHILSTEGDRMSVRVEIHDLGFDATNPNRKLAASGTIVFAPERPLPPTAGTFELKNERPCRISIEVLYRNLFHGDMFLGVRSMPRVGDDGIEADIEVLPRDSLFGSTTRPNLILDPVLLDIVMHPLAAWHLEQPDQAGRILLPIGLKRLEVYGPPPEVGTRLQSRGRITEQSARHFVKCFDAVDEFGQVLYRFDSVQYWRFYVPFGEVNFHGPKDEYFLSAKQPLPEGVEQSERADAVWMWFDPPLDIRQPVIRGAAAKVTLGADEFATYRSLEAADQEIDSWLFGRIAMKDAARQLWFEREGKRHYPADLFVAQRDRGRFELQWRKPGEHTTSDYRDDAARALPRVDVATVDGQAFAIATYSDRVGIAACRNSNVDADVAISAAETSMLPAEAEQQWSTRLTLSKCAAARAFDCEASQIVCKDVDLATASFLVQIGDGETASVATTAAGEYFVAMVIA